MNLPETHRAVQVSGWEPLGPTALNVLEGTATRGGRAIALTDGEFSVLTVLALSRHVATRDELCDALWPDRGSPAAASLLKVYVHRIRSKFEHAGVVERCARGYRLGADVRVDLLVLEGPSRAPASGAPVLGADERLTWQHAFDGFRARRYARLSGLDCYGDLERRIVVIGTEAARALVLDALARADTARALALAETLVAHEPYDDVAAELFIRAQQAVGRRDTAFRFFRTYCRTLRDELALPPPQHLARLVTGDLPRSEMIASTPATGFPILQETNQC